MARHRTHAEMIAHLNEQIERKYNTFAAFARDASDETADYEDRERDRRLARDYCNEWMALRRLRNWYTGQE